LLVHSRWFSPGTLASSTTKTGRHDITEILLKVALNTKIQSIINIVLDLFSPRICMKSRPLGNQYICLLIYPFVFSDDVKKNYHKLWDRNWNYHQIKIVIECLSKQQSLNILMCAHLRLSTQKPSSGTTATCTRELLFQWESTFKIQPNVLI
jgi:hypothetical protein